MTKPQRASTKRFTTAEKVNAVMRLLNGETLEALGTELGVTIHRLQRWQNDFVVGGSAALGKRKGTGAGDWFAKNAAAIFHSLALLVALGIMIGLLAQFIQHAEASRSATSIVR